MFAAAALALSRMGIFCVLALAVRERTHELGVRRALGAHRRDLVRIVLARSAWMVGTGLVVGSALAWLSSRLTESLLFGVRPNDPATFAAVGAVLSLSALLATILPAFRATTVDPLVAIKEE
jgi:putative ABC transport system permease protein